MTTDKAIREHTKALLAATAAREYFRQCSRPDRCAILRRINLATFWRQTISVREELRFFEALPGHPHPARDRRGSPPRVRRPQCNTTSRGPHNAL